MIFVEKKINVEIYNDVTFENLPSFHNLLCWFDPPGLYTYYGYLPPRSRSESRDGLSVTLQST